MKLERTDGEPNASPPTCLVLVVLVAVFAAATVGQDGPGKPEADLRKKAEGIRASADSLFKLRRIPWVTDPDRIASTMVPVAVDRWKADDPRTREAEFLRPFLKKHPPQGSPCIYSPAGKVLGGFRGFGDMAGRTKKLVEDALQRFGPVEPRKVKAVEIHPYRGRGRMSDGSVRLAEYVRPSDKSLAFLNTRTPVIASVTLSAVEFAALAPQEAVVGKKWIVPVEVAKKFCRVTSPMCYQHAPQPAQDPTDDDGIGCAQTAPACA